MVPNYYPKGAVVTVDATFRAFNADGSPGVLIDPDTVVFKYQSPNGSITTGTYPAGGIIRDAEGRYHLNITASIVGRWYTQVSGDGALMDSYFIVNPSVF
jgi:hypothetical protein